MVKALVNEKRQCARISSRESSIDSVNETKTTDDEDDRRASVSPLHLGQRSLKAFRPLPHVEQYIPLELVEVAVVLTSLYAGTSLPDDPRRHGSPSRD